MNNKDKLLNFINRLDYISKDSDIFSIFFCQMKEYIRKTDDLFIIKDIKNDIDNIENIIQIILKKTENPFVKKKITHLYKPIILQINKRMSKKDLDILKNILLEY